MGIFDNLSISVEMPLGVNASNDFSSFRDSFHIESLYGLIAQAGNLPSISNFLSISVPNTEPVSFLYAVIRGVIRYVPDENSPRIELRPFPFDSLQLGKQPFNSLPPFLFIYRGVDTSSVATAAEILLSNAPISEADRPVQLIEFMSGNRSLTVEGGMVIGKPAIDPSLGGRRRLDLAVQINQGIYLNPAHYLYRWPLFRPELETHPLLSQLKSQQHGHLFPTKDRILFVRQNSSNPTSPYTTADTAAHSLGEAMNAARAGDIVCAIDNATYQERVFMQRGVTLTSAGILRNIGQPSESSDLPTLSQPTNSNTNNYAEIVAFDNLNQDPTHISGFKITQATAAVAGAGIVIRRSQNVEIAQNLIYGNHAIQGGGVGIFDSRGVRVSFSRIYNNQVNDVEGVKGQGGGLYIGGSSTNVSIEDCFIYSNTATNFGGGVCVNDPAIEIAFLRNQIGGTTAAQGNRVTGNRLGIQDAAIYDNPQGGGGGIGVFKTGILSVANEITYNEAHCGGELNFM
ncbi:right-handed parallel beta-helix repeat-containing protein [Candidatus Paracaedibacter symbiosus]|uniref:right-handed parallel beta-helix repeat-containing protein n=1 Tax=Candidatus Paracaedibacter symbiosus TaxID=244582 RepID=UPI000509B613|nr:right-handed parallel beta-helix repeat-containing protein [Candidatus Paracaedibacter symbiosus]